MPCSGAMFKQFVFIHKKCPATHLSVGFISCEGRGRGMNQFSRCIIVT